MSTHEISDVLPAQPMPDNIPNTQPGGGVCYSIEQAWGRLRRVYLRALRLGYVRRMAKCRHGDVAGLPHEVIDDRDLKFLRNQTDAYWDDADNLFRWRDRLPFARWGLAELQLMGYPLLVLTLWLAVTPWWYAAVVPAVLFLFVLWFFRDPPRRVPEGPGLIVSPADGKLVEVTPLDYHEFIGGPAVRIGIFLTIFNVHVNRVPERLRVIYLRYSPGLFLNAMSPESALRNENMEIGLQQTEAPYRRMVCRQIAGLLARRIVCDARPGRVYERGAKFGMIKLGSRTELILPADGLTVVPPLGTWLNAGRDVLGRYAEADADATASTKAN